MLLSICLSPLPQFLLWGIWGYLAVSMYLLNVLVFYAVCFVLDESGLLVLPRMSFIYYEMTLLSVCVCVCVCVHHSFLRLMKSPCYLCAPPPTQIFVFCVIPKESRWLFLPRTYLSTRCAGFLMTDWWIVNDKMLVKEMMIMVGIWDLKIYMGSRSE
jgi:hypothetical protein